MKRRLAKGSSIKKIIIILIIMFSPEYPAQEKVWSLQDCIDSALINNKNVQISTNNVLAAGEKHKESVAGLIPKINVTADYKYFTALPYQLMPMSTFGGPADKFRETQFGVPHNINASVQLSVPIYNSQVYGAISTTGLASGMVEKQLQKTKEQVIYEISNLYFSAQVLYHQMKFLDSNIVNSSRLLENVRLLRKQLMARRTDEEKIELQKSQLLTKKEILNSNLEQVLNALKIAMGQSPDVIIKIDTEMKFENTRTYSASPVIDMQLAEMQKQILSSELKTLKKSRLPSFTLYGAVSQTGFGYDKQPNDFLKFFPSGFAGLQMNFPIFNGTVTLRKINQKEIDIKNSELQIMQINDQNNIQILNAENRRRTSIQAIGDTEKQIALAASVYQNTILQQKEGTAGLTEVLLADAALIEAQQANISAIAEYLKSDLELKKATGNILLKK